MAAKHGSRARLQLHRSAVACFMILTAVIHVSCERLLGTRFAGCPCRPRLLRMYMRDA